MSVNFIIHTLDYGLKVKAIKLHMSSYAILRYPYIYIYIYIYIY